MKFKSAKMVVLAAVLAIAPVSSAWAHGHGHGHWGRGPAEGLFLLGAAIVETTAIILSAPFVALASSPEPAYYAPPSGYYAPPPSGYYSPPPAYYPAPPRYYSYPPRYYGAPHGYYRR